jgi:hypothetical protein
LKSENQYVALSAAKSILEHFLSYRSVVAIEARVAALEAAVATGQAGPGSSTLATAARLMESPNGNGHAEGE